MFSFCPHFALSEAFPWSKKATNPLFNCSAVNAFILPVDDNELIPIALTASPVCSIPLIVSFALLLYAKMPAAVLEESQITPARRPD